MSKKRKLINIQEICRFCLNDDNEMIELTTPEIHKKVREFSETTSIIIEDVDYLPKKICHVCVYKLESWYDFKRQLKRSYIILMNYLKNGDLIIDNPDVDTKFTDLTSNIENNLTNFIKQDPIKPDGLSSELDLKPEIEDLSPIASKNRLNTQLNSLEKTLEAPELLTPKLESTSDGKIHLSPVRSRPSSVRRTSEQRLASTQRWVARKRALLAATGQNESDTDSMGSDITQLSPMKKARVKCNERDLEMKKNQQPMSSENNLVNNNDLEDAFKPQTVQSEVKIGDSIFVVTSTLFLSEPQFINQSLDNLKVQNNEEVDQNMDIIDALQLRRVNDNNKQPNDKLLEKCLNIEVEGTELEALQKVQLELASFVETEIKNKLVDINKEVVKQESKPQDSLQTLEQQLKIIVEKAIKKNLDNYQTKRLPMNKLNRKNNTFPSTFVKAAVKSSIFQPKVMVDRLDPKVLETFVKNEAESDPLDVKENLENCQDLVTQEKHTCGTCSMNFVSKALLNEHLVIHKPKKDIASIKPGTKRKLMRCKRCHEIVDAELVKFHVCLTKNHQCKVCNQIFRTENLLASHQKTHQDQVVIEKIPNADFSKNINCFICDKVFSDAEKLKDHLQNHCDDDDESSSNNVKDKVFQCAICGTTVDTEEKLESHVEQHLFNDADDNPDMIDVVVDKKKDKQQSELHSCVECNGKFDTEINLAFHMQAHEEEAAIAEWEDEYKMNGLYACTICYDAFDNEQQLADHFDVHNCSSHTCVLCDKPFLTLAELQEHVSTH